MVFQSYNILVIFAWATDQISSLIGTPTGFGMAHSRAMREHQSSLVLRPQVQKYPPSKVHGSPDPSELVDSDTFIKTYKAAFCLSVCISVGIRKFCCCLMPS
jgi:hypothetical protein